MRFVFIKKCNGSSSQLPLAEKTPGSGRRAATHFPWPFSPPVISLLSLCAWVTFPMVHFCTEFGFNLYNLSSVSQGTSQGAHPALGSLCSDFRTFCG